MDTNLLVSKSLSNGIDSSSHEDLDDFVLQLEDDINSEDNLNEGSFINGDSDSSACKISENTIEAVPECIEKDSLELAIEIDDVEKTEEEFRKSNHDRLNETSVTENVSNMLVTKIGKSHSDDENVDVIIVKNFKLNRSTDSQIVDVIPKPNNNSIIDKGEIAVNTVSETKLTQNNSLPPETEGSISNGTPLVQMDVVAETTCPTTEDNLTEDVKVKLEDTSAILSSEIIVEDGISIKKEKYDMPPVSNGISSHDLIDEKPPKTEESYSDLKMIVYPEPSCDDSQQSTNTDSIDCEDINEHPSLDNFNGSYRQQHRKRKSLDEGEDTYSTFVSNGSLNSMKKGRFRDDVEEIQPNLINGFTERIALDNEDVRPPKRIKESNNRNNIIVNGHSIEDEVVNIIKRKKPLDKNERMQARLQIFNSFYSNDSTIAVNRDVLEEITLKKVVEYLSFSSENALLRQRCKVLQNEEVRMLKTVNSLKKQLEDAKHIIKKLIDEKISGQPWAQGVAPLRVTRSVGLQVCTVGSVNVISTKSKERESLKLLRKRDGVRSPKTVVQTPTSTSNDGINSSVSTNNIFSSSSRNDTVRTDEESITEVAQVNAPPISSLPMNDLTTTPKPITTSPTDSPSANTLFPANSQNKIILGKREPLRNQNEKKSTTSFEATDLIDLTDDTPAVTSSTDICPLKQEKDSWSSMPKQQKDVSLPPKQLMDMSSKQSKDIFILPKQQKDVFLPPKQHDAFPPTMQQMEGTLLPKQQMERGPLLPKKWMEGGGPLLPKQQMERGPLLPKQRMEGGPLMPKQQKEGTLLPKLNTQSTICAKPSTTLFGVNKSSASVSLKPTTPVNTSTELPKFPPSPTYPPDTEKPPKPILRIGKNTGGKSEKQGIMLSWTFEAGVDISTIKEYQLYAYQENKPLSSEETHEKAEKPETWKKVGDIKALPLPMACFLTQFVEGHKYHFIVRAVDLDKKLGDFSLPGSIVLNTKMSPAYNISRKTPGKARPYSTTKDTTPN